MSIKRLLIPMALVVALVLPATASAIARDFSGNVDPSGTIDFTYKKRNGHRKVVNLEFDGVPIDCSDGSTTTFGNTSGFVFKVSDGKFGDTLTNGDGATLKVHGEFRNRFHRAIGTLRVFGNNVPVTSGPGDGCDTGRLDWTAHS